MPKTTHFDVIRIRNAFFFQNEILISFLALIVLHNLWSTFVNKMNSEPTEKRWTF